MDYRKKLEQLINDGKNWIKEGVTDTDPKLESWKTQVSSLLANQFGNNSEELKAFKNRFVAFPVATGKPRIPVNEIQATVYELESYLRDLDF